MGRTNTAQRHQIVSLAQAGASKTSIMRQLDIGRAAVDRWWPCGSRAAPDLTDLPRSGRPRLLSSPVVKAMKRSARRGATASKISRTFELPNKSGVSRQTVARALKSGSKPLRYLKTRATRVLSDANKIKRVDFCGSFKCPPRTSLVFIDAKMCTLYRGSNQRYSFRWTTIGDPPVKTTGKLVARLQFYAAVAHGFKSRLYFVPPSTPRSSTVSQSPETFKAKHYAEAMKEIHDELEEHFGGGKYLIIRDRATQHIKAEGEGMLPMLEGKILEDYPPQSWDINCIEHVWAQLVQKLSKHRASTVDGFYVVVERAWGSISQVTIDKLVGNVPQRMEKIAAMGGEWIDKYNNKF